MATQPGFFDVEERLRRLSDIGDHLGTSIYLANSRNL